MSKIVAHQIQKNLHIRRSVAFAILGKKHKHTKEDGAPPHYAIVVRRYLDDVFPHRWIGRRGPRNGPPDHQNGIGDWADACQKGKRQSPIGICKTKAKSTFIPPLKFLYYNSRYKACVKNNGETVEIGINDKAKCEEPTITGGNLDGEFVLKNIHFHWESEHTINGKRYPLEVHYVHYNKKCECFDIATIHPNGLVILSAVFEIADCCNPRLDNVINAAEMVSDRVNVSAQIKGGIIVDHFLPKNKTKFYMYKGSESPPTCSENVKWIIFEDILPIGQDQLNRLTNVISSSGERVQKNCRSLQEPNDREVLYSSDTVTMKHITDFIKDKIGKSKKNG